MNETITIEKSLFAYFKQPFGSPRPGMDWAIQITGARDGMVLVRTYFSSNPPQDAEKNELAGKAVRFVQRKLEQGWIPWAGILEYEDERAE